jgi:hypothetical protein
MLVAVALLTMSASVRADIAFKPGNDPDQELNTENVLFEDQTDNPVFGLTNQTQLQVNFSSNADDQLIAKGGQASIESADGATNSLKIEVPGGFFTGIIFNPTRIDSQSNTTARITVEEVNGDISVLDDFPIDQGNNFLTIVASNGQQIKSVTIDSGANGADGLGFGTTDQIRIAGAATVVPEPSTMALALVGVAGLGLRGLRRFRRKPVATA